MVTNVEKANIADGGYMSINCVIIATFSVCLKVFIVKWEKKR